MNKSLVIASPVGELTLVSDGQHLIGLYFQRHAPAPAQSGSQAVCPILQSAANELGQYFASERMEFTVPVRMVGTPFQRQVWAKLLEIPYGQTRSYKWLAEQIGCLDGCRAVGQANGHNPVSIIVPCHRVVNADGKLGGYGGGLDRKRLLLGLENGEKSLF